jgi:WD40 repeat protein
LVTIWDGESLSRPRVLRGHNRVVHGVTWSPDGKMLANSGWDSTIRIWDATTGAEVQILQDPDHVDALIFGVAWSPDGRKVASGSGNQGQGDNGEICVWDAHSGERVRALAEHPGAAFAVVWSPSGERLVCAGSDGRLRWWDMQNGECVRMREAHQGTVQALKGSPDGTRLASCGDDRAIRLWELKSGEPLQTLRRDRPYERLNITGIPGLTEAQKVSLRTLGAVEETSVGR